MLDLDGESDHRRRAWAEESPSLTPMSRGVELEVWVIVVARVRLYPSGKGGGERGRSPVQGWTTVHSLAMMRH